MAKRPRSCLIVLLVAAALLSAFGDPRAQEEDTLARAERLSGEAVQLYRAGRLREALANAREALALREQALGPSHLDVAMSLNNLGVVLRAMGDFAAARPLYERALAIREQRLGPADPSVAQSSSNLADLLHSSGEYAAARALYERALAIRERALGPEHRDTATTLNNLALLRAATGDNTGARPLLERVVRIFEATLGPNHPNVAGGLNNLAAVLRALGDYAGARSHFERALRIAETVLSPTDPNLATALNNLAAVQAATGDFGSARPLYERALAIREQALGPAHPSVAQSLGNLGDLFRRTGDYPRARSLYERALRISEQARGPFHPDVATTLNNLAVLSREMGDYAGARGLHERALGILEQALGPAHADVGTALDNLAGVLESTGDHAAARPLYERALALREQALGPAHPDVAASLHNLAFLLRRTRQAPEARRLYERALAIREQALGPTHPDVAATLNNLAMLLEDAGDAGAARPLYERSVRITEQALGASHPELAIGLHNLAALRAVTGDVAGARTLAERAVAIFEQALGPTHPQVAVSTEVLGVLHETAGDLTAARRLYERARLIRLAVVRSNSALDDEGMRGLLRGSRRALHDYVGLLATLAQAPAPDPATPPVSAHAFLVADQAKGGSAQAALARAGVRAAAADPATATLARQVQDLADRRSALGRQLVAEYGRHATERDAGRLASLRTTTARLDQDLAAAAERLRRAFPRYADLAAPDPIAVDETQRLLRPDEVLVSFLVLDKRLLVWVVRPNRPFAYHDAPVTRVEVAALVARVRRSLDQSANADLPSARLAPFDVAGAQRLYELLLRPVASALEGVRHLIIVPDEVLLPLPFGALLTRAEGEIATRLADLYERGLAPSPLEMADYASLAWLAKELAMTVLPSATSLRALRQTARAKTANVEPLIGFGDPVLQGAGQRRGGVMLATRSAAAVGEVARLDRLPGTRDELLAAARALGADPARALFLGPDATKPRVLSLDAAGRLGKARVVAFATHGLLAGEMTGLRQPALVLTPPSQPSPDDDGLFSLDDIVGLKLVATDWVVLSACNTGGGDGSGEALSGLVRAFFFAGTPALLVSHWSVDDRATQALMTAVFERYARDPATPRAEALRQAMLAVMASARGATGYFAHPFAWAPFFLVGEGGPA